MTSPSLIVKAPRVRRAPNRYSPSPTTAHFSSSRTHKRTPKKKKETSTKARTTPKKKKTTTTTKPTPKKITKAKKKEKKKEKEAPAITTTPSIPKKEKKGRKPNIPQRTLAPTSVWYSNVGIEVPPFNNKFTQAQIEEMESLVSPWYGVDDIIRRLKSVRKRSILDD